MTNQKYLAFFLLFALLTLGACNYTIKIKDGRTAYERKQYAAAIPMLQKEFGQIGRASCRERV